MGFFKAYDMRGTFGVDFDLETVVKVGRALPEVVPGRRWLVGRDCRETSVAVRDALVRGLVAAGAEVTDLGECTTPMVYYFTAADEFDGSVMITASHNPPTDNGLKVSRRTALPVGYADGLAQVERLILGPALAPAAESGSVSLATEQTSAEFRRRYVAFLREMIGSEATRIDGLRLGIDCSNGMSSLLVKDLFPNAVVINDVPDGRFPCHSPNPLQASAREQIAELVRQQRLDCGVIFDGDADRAMFVDERGEFVQPDYLIPVLARAVRRGSLKSGKTVLHDVRTSRGAIEVLREDGFEPVMVPVGHAFAKPRMRATGAVCGGELAGHYYFGDFFGCDSGVLAALRICGELARAKSDGHAFSQVMQPILGRYANSGELNFKVADKPAAINRVLATVAEKFPQERSRSEMDGIRLEYDDGWFNVRLSNTEPYLRLLAEARTASILNEWLRILSAAIGA